MTAELRHIEAFLAVARCGSFTRAASELHVSQPALTVQIHQLEAALGLRLFDRNNRNVDPSAKCFHVDLGIRTDELSQVFRG